MNDDQDRSALEHADDRILAGRAADGDAAAFAVLVRRYAPMMRAYARRILPGTAELDDVVQEACIAAWEQLDTIEHPDRVKSWLMRITSRKAIDRIRSIRPCSDIETLEISVSASSDPPRRAEANAGLAALAEALNQLPESQRQCWVLREIGEYSYDEIAEELGLSTATVRGQLARARKHIIVRMEEWR
ncbi:RNA polymerase sigma factor [Leucobacter albus]|uniref:RNA polymerase sigma factor n=1 Tax=Leucobacter albus TaxID=272210 RepID=A0ABW3TQC0_9MICO